MKRRFPSVLYIVLIALCAILFVSELAFGSISIPFAEVLNILFSSPDPESSSTIIVLESRLPRACTAAIGAASLALSGLLMQTLFRNPLAGPSVLGISSGASLGVAFLMLTIGGTGIAFLSGSFSIAIAAILGAIAVLFFIMLAAGKLNDNVSLLIFGIMFAHITSAIVSILQYSSTAEALRNFVLWTFGSFAETSWHAILIMLLFLLIGIALSFLILPSLNILLLGEEYASSMGVNVKRCRNMMIIATGAMAGSITAFCGPVAFIGLTVPHIARMMFATSNHFTIMPASILLGIIAGLLCDLISRIAEVPLNAITAAMGAPLVIYLVFRGASSKALI